jgi:hypothetical protein
MIKYTRSEDYGRRGRAPRRRRHVPARSLDEPGQLDLGQLERGEALRRARCYQCPDCHAPKGQPCTRPPSIRETVRQPLRWMCHAGRYALITGAEDLTKVEDNKSAKVGRSSPPDMSRWP